MDLLEQTARQAAKDYGLTNKKTRGDLIGALKCIRTICRVDYRTARRALEAACPQGIRKYYGEDTPND